MRVCGVALVVSVSVVVVLPDGGTVEGVPAVLAKVPCAENRPNTPA